MSHISVVASVDLVIVGGSSGAVACALAARRSGLTVLVAAPQTGVADDIAGHLRLRPEAPIADALAAVLFPDGQCPSPLHARRRSELALIEAGVRLLLQVLPCGVLRGSDGSIRGVVLAHRGGLSAVQAKAVVDAGQLAPLARLAGVAWTPWAGGSLEVETILLGLEPGTVPGEDVGPVTLPGAEACTLPLLRRVDYLPLPSVTVGDLAALESSRQLTAFHPGAKGMSDWAFFVPPQACTAAPMVEQWSGSQALPLECLASGQPGLWILGGAAALSRSTAASLLAPAALSAVGDRLGAAIAAQTRPQDLAVQAEIIGSGSGAGVLRGPRGGLRSSAGELPTVPVREIAAPDLASVEVLVVGGGTGGAPAGIAAARAGARTLVIERLHRLGGVGTLGRIGRYWFGNKTGFTAEIDQRVFTGYGEPRFPKQQGSWWALEHKQDAWLRLLHEAGASCWYGAQACAALVTETADSEDAQVIGALVATIHGAGLVRAKACVDASGSADLAAAAGAPCRVTAAEHIAVQGTGLPPVDPRSDYQNSDHDFCDDSDPEDVTRMLVRGRAKFATAWDTGPHIDSRERRQIRGRYELTPLDICCDRSFPDAVVRATSNFDSHGFTVHPVFLAFPMDKKPMHAWIPYRCLQPQRLDGILVTGLGMSAHRDALPVVRMQPDVQNAGYSAGTAAAMAAAADGSTVRLSVSALQQRLIDIGHLDPGVRELRDSFPIPDTEVEALIAERLGELRSIAAAFAAGSTAWPALQAALTDPERRETAAIILGLQGQAIAAPVLRELLADRVWDNGWRFTGMGQFGRSMSAIDTRLVALAHCGEAADLAIVADFAASLPEDPELSHIRGLAWSCSEFVRLRPELATPAAALLKAIIARPGMAGHAWTTLSEALDGVDADTINTREREEALRELHLAVALWRCGDRQSARTYLDAYARDLRGHYARHASAVMAGG